MRLSATCSCWILNLHRATPFGKGTRTARSTRVESVPEAWAAPFTAFWSASMPAGPAAPVDPAVVAQTIVSQMELRAFDIGMVPEDRPGSMGIVGLPMWLWVTQSVGADLRADGAVSVARGR